MAPPVTIARGVAVPLWIHDPCGSTHAAARPGATNRVVTHQHLVHHVRRAYQPRLGQLRKSIGELAGVRLLVTVGRALQPRRILSLFLCVVGAHDPRARLGVVFVRRWLAHLGPPRELVATRGRRRGLACLVPSAWRQLQGR